MIVVYAFIGKLPSYCIETVHQLRIFYSGEVYFIVSDYESEHITVLESKYNTKIIRYDAVVDNKFLSTVASAEHKFYHMPTLHGREDLFIRAFERFYVLSNFMGRKHTDVFFLELDNLIYDNPEKWLNSFRTKEMAYMFDNYQRYSSGICYIKNNQILEGFLVECTNFIETATSFMTEMTVLYKFYEQNKLDVQILPTHWMDRIYPPQTYENFDLYDSIFDALSMGIYICGIDLCHSNGTLETKRKNPWGLIDYTKYTYVWVTHENYGKIPYVRYADKLIRINNLHVHSKDLKSHLSLPL